jgi:hypothetical protein
MPERDENIMILKTYKEMCKMAMKAIPQHEFQKCFRTVACSIVELSAYLLKGNTSKVTESITK